MIKEKKRFDFMVFRIEVQMRDEPPYGFSEEALGGVYDEPNNDNIYMIWFNKLPSKEAIVHECWHLFMTLMAQVDNHEHGFLELNGEIYAYSFHILYSNILDALCSMKYYNQLYKEWQEEKKNGKSDA